MSDFSTLGNTVYAGKGGNGRVRMALVVAALYLFFALQAWGWV